MLRVDREETRPLGKNEEDALFTGLAPLIGHHEVLILSDYGKGLVGPRLMRRLRSLLLSLPRPPFLLIDPQPRHVRLYRGAYLLTPNAGESGEAVNLPVRTREEILKAGRAVLKRSGCRHLLITLGARGMALFQDNGEVWRIPTSARAVFDVSGAGDTVISAAALALAAGMPLLPACMLANFAAGVVVAQVGTASATPQQLIEAVTTWPVPDMEKWAPL
jgi:rfaE bifunctional protein kinase chain/domain